MSDDLPGQLAEYGRYHQAEQQPVDITAITEAPGIDDAEGILVDFEAIEIRRAVAMKNRWITRTGAAVAAAAVVIVAIVALSDDESADVAAPPDPEDVVDAFFTAYNAGDTDAALALLTADATLTEQFGSTDDLDAEDEIDRDSWEGDLEFFIAQGSVLSSHSCTEAAEQPTDATVFSCDYELLDGPTQAVGAVPVPVMTGITVTEAGRISEFHAWYDPLETGVDYLHVGRPFGRWLKANHPEFADLAITDEPGAACCASMTTTERGLLVVQYAQEWAVYLEENGCTYLDGC